MKIISACLMGINCRYDGKCDPLNFSNIIKTDDFIPVCAEQLGGLSTPREGSGILNGTGKEVIEGKCRVLNMKNDDVTENFIRGAEEVLKIANMYKCEEAILRNGSPSCGVKKSFQTRVENGKIINEKKDGEGVLTALLKKNGIKVTAHDEFKKEEFE